LFQSLGEEAMILELDVRSDGAAIQAELANMTGQRSVPNVFVNGKHVGGNDDTHAAHQSGKLDQLLRMKR
jgi:glutaredoxin 3